MRAAVEQNMSRIAANTAKFRAMKHVLASFEAELRRLCNLEGKYERIS